MLLIATAIGALVVLGLNVHFARRRVQLALIPLSGVCRVEGDPNGFRCVGSAPTFRLESPQGLKLPIHWVYVQGRCERRGTELYASLIATDEQGVDQVISVPSMRSGVIKHVVCLPAIVRELRWQPLEGPGTVMQVGLTLTELSPLERVARMVSWAAYDLWKFRRTEACAEVGLRPWLLLTDLDGAYAASAKLRAHAPRILEETLAILDASACERALIEARARTLAHLASGKKLPSVLLLIDAAYATPHEREAAVGAAQSTCAKANARLIVMARLEEAIPWEAMASHDLVVFVAAHECVPAAYFLEFFIDAHLCSPAAQLLTGDDVLVDSAGVRLHARGRGSAWNAERVEASLHAGCVVAVRGACLAKLSGHLLIAPGTAIFGSVLRILHDEPSAKTAHVAHSLARAHRELDARSPEELLRLCEVLAAHHAQTTGSDIGAGLTAGTVRVAYAIPHPAPRVTILIPTRDTVEVLRTCIESLLAKTDYANYEIVILDNQSREHAAVAYLRELEARGAARVLAYDAPFNYSAINNFGVRETRGELLAFLNNDLEFTRGDWLSEMVGHAMRAEVGAVGAKLLYPDGFVQHAGVVLGIGGVAHHAYRLSAGDERGVENRLVVTQQCSAVTGACLVMRREAFERAGGFDEAHLPVAFNDVDMCLKLREMGLRIVWTPHASLLHHESYSRGQDQATRSKRRRAEAEMRYMRERWGTATMSDSFSSATLAARHR